MQPLSQFFKDKKQININVDSDGIFSAAILRKYYDCEICGFNNNDKIILHEKGIPYEDLTYVDLRVGYPHIRCIDQHMVSVDEKHNEILKANPNKINPNVEFDVVWKDYTHKFPFSTTIYLLVKAEAEGKDLSNIDLDVQVAQGITLGDLIWHTDSSSDNFYKYNVNASNWIERLKKMSNNGAFTLRLIKYLENHVPSDFSTRATYYMRIGLWYRETFGCDNNHGGIRQDFIDTNGKIIPKMFSYIQHIFALLDTNANELEDKLFDMTVFKSKRFSYADKKDTFDSAKLFSYSFIWGMNKDKNISATYQ